MAIDIYKKSLCDAIGDAHHLPFKENIFRKVVLYEVLEHLNDASEVLTEINRVLRKNGILEFSVPNAMHYRAILRWVANGKISVSPDHINCWRLPEIENLLRKTRFTVVRIDFIDAHFAHPSFFQNLLPRITRHSLLVKAVKR